jgi:bifunctional DNase/RNase
MSLPVPLTHVAIGSIIRCLGATLAEANIACRHKDGYYIAELVLNNATGSVVIQMRPSDAITLAIYSTAPINVSDELLLWRRQADNGASFGEEYS